MDTISYSFNFTFLLLSFSTIITGVEALKTTDLKLRIILTLETFISLLAGYVYKTFLIHAKTEKEIIGWRYLDWVITTPFLLLCLCLLLADEIIWGPFIIILIFNKIMLFSGLLGELNIINKYTGLIVGFIAMIIMFILIYINFYVEKNTFLFWFFIVLWSGYGIVYLLDDILKLYLYNILDVFSKVGVGLLTWALAVGLLKEL